MLVNTTQVNDWWSIDAIQIGMPVIAKLAKLTGEQKYFDKMWDMYEYTRNKQDVYKRQLYSFRISGKLNKKAY